MKNIVPEITAYYLEEATAILDKYGIKYNIREIYSLPFSRKIKNQGTGKDQNKVTGNAYRVLKQTLLAENILELIVAREIT